MRSENRISRSGNRRIDGYIVHHVRYSSTVFDLERLFSRAGNVDYMKIDLFGAVSENSEISSSTKQTVLFKPSWRQSNRFESFLELSNRKSSIPINSIRKSSVSLNSIRKLSVSVNPNRAVSKSIDRSGRVRLSVHLWLGAPMQRHYHSWRFRMCIRNQRNPPSP